MRPPSTANKFFSVSSSRGQGTLEFILLLVISVGLILLFSKNFFKPFGQYANSYMGSYLACLLDKGVLPKLGSDDDSCADAMNLPEGNPFNSKSGKKSLNAGGGSGENQPSERPSEMSEMESSRSGVSGRTSSSRSGGPYRHSSPRGSDGVAQDSKVTTVPNPLAESQFFKVTRYGSAESNRRKIRRVSGLAGLIDSERERIEKREHRISKVGAVEAGEGRGKGKKLRVQLSERKLAAEEEAKPMTFGKFVRLLIIIAIILAVIVFLGTQANQISQSSEK
jgi:hypothetical protein